jgi:hypothetical protein
VSTLAGYVSCAFFKDIGADGIEFSFSCEPDHQGQQGGFAKFVQIQAQDGDETLGCLWHFSSAPGANEGLKLIFDYLARREVPHGFPEDDFDFPMKVRAVEEFGVGRTASKQR